MNREKIEKIIVVAILCVGLAALIILGVWGFKMFSEHQAEIKDKIRMPIESVLRNPKQTEKPRREEGEPLICKMELVGLHNEAEKNGANGMLILETYDRETDVCSMYIQNMTAPRKRGTVQFLHSVDGKRYGITLKMEKADLMQVRLWTEAALLFFNNGISAEEASGAVMTALAEGKAVSNLFTIAVYDDVFLDGSNVTPVQRIEILSVSE